jgi:hypothetical protein
VIVTHPEQIAVVHHYARADRVRWATALGPTSDPRVFDWRDAPARLRAVQPDRIVDGARSGRVVLVEPAALRRGGPEWLDLVVRRATDWREAADRNPGLRRVKVVAPTPQHGTDLRAVVYELREP